MMRNSKITRSLLSLLLSVLILLTSTPMESVLAATKETEKCVDCSGTGTIACADCVGGYKSTDCTVCGGTGLFEENPCEACDGTGKEKCETCGATGFVECSTCNGTGKIEVEYEICPVCNGDKKCTTCSGEGTVKNPCTNSACNNGKIDVDCPDCEDGNIEVSCSNCSGAGTVIQTVSVSCTNCSGTGKLVDDVDCPDCEDGMVESLQAVDCDKCVAGKVKQVCSTCSGVGTVEQNCAVCVGTGKIDSVCSECSGDKKCSNCLGTGKIKTVADTSFAFEHLTPANIKVGDTFVNTASSSNNTTGTVSYEVDDDTIAVITNDGTLTAKKVGTVTVTAKIVTDYTFSSAEATYTITIDKATPVISSVSATAITYGQKLSDSTVSAVAKVGTTEIAGSFAWADSVKNEVPTVVTDSDNTEYEAVFTPDDTDNYTTATFKAKVIVNKADITGITVTGCNHVYDGTAVDAVSVSGLEASDTVKYSTDNGNTYLTSMPKLTNVSDSKTVYVSVTRDGNYNDYVTSVAAEVNPAKIDGVSFDVYSGTYDGKEHPAVAISGDGYKKGDTVTYTYDGNTYTDLKFKDAGEYEVEVTISRADENYKDTKFPEETDAKFKVVISKADVTVKANNVSKEYTGEVLTSSNTEASISGEVEGHKLTAQINGSGTTVGEYTLTPSNIVICDAEGNDVTKNYNISTENGILDITKRHLKITAKNVDAIYNAKPYSSNVFYKELEDRYYQEGLVEGHTIVELTIDGEKTAADSYLGILVPSGAVIKSGDEETTSNYDIEYVSGDMTISYLEIADVNDIYTVNDANDFGWYNGKVILTAKDGYKLCYTNDDSDSFKDYVEYTTEGVTKPAIAVMEIATGYITDILECNQVKIDTVKPNVFDIKYKPAEAYKEMLEKVTFGFYKAPTVVTIYASDATSDIESVSYKLTGADYVDVNVADMTFDEGKYSYDIEIPASFKGQVQYYAKDKSGLQSETKSDDNGIIVDVTDPAIDEIDYNTTIFRDSKYYYSGDVVVDFAVNEEYFFAEYMDSAKIDVKAIDSAVTVKVTKIGEDDTVEDYTNFEKVLDETAKTISVKIPSSNNDGDYVIDLTYADPAGNSVNVKTDTIVIDTTAPVVTVSYDNNTVNSKSKDNTYFDKARIATITVVEHNFAPEYIDTEIIANDILTAADDEMGITTSVAEKLKKITDYSEWTHNGNTHKFTLEYRDDAIYDFSLTSFKDYALNEMNPENDNKVIYADGTVSPEHFVVDQTKPENLEISYSLPVVQQILERLTFGFYQAPCIVTLTAEDNVSSVQYFTYRYDVTQDSVNPDDKGKAVEEAKATSSETNAVNGKGTLTFRIPAQFRGKVSATAVNNCGVETEKLIDENNRIVVDNVSPILSVSYTSEGKVNFTKGENHEDAKDFASADQAYCDKPVVSTITIDEANFFEGKQKYVIDEDNEHQEDGFVHQVGIQLVKTDNNGNISKIEYLPQGTDNLFDDSMATEIINWNNDGTKHSFTINYDADADYKLIVKYDSDFSSNSTVIEDASTTESSIMSEYTYESKTITVDTIAPKVSVIYEQNPKAVHTIDGRDGREYFDSNRSATITVNEHNFRASDFETKDLLLANNILGNEVTNYISYFKDEKNWTIDANDPTGNTHIIKIDFKSDANYTFDFSFVDLAKNACADYDADLFTVDKTAPKNLKVSYSTSVFDTVINAITFGYYDKKMTVTISADDDTSGIYHFMYSYLIADGVSKVNTGLVNDAIKHAKITLNGKTSTATFNIPKSELTNQNQFNGTVEFTAYDFAENSTYKEDNKRVIVDNISPTATISYNNPVQNANNVSYYSGDINATIVINEANFYKEDVVVTVSKNGSDSRINPKWTDNSVDKHTGTFTLSGDGDYVVKISYADRSGNKMTEYKSNQLTIDTKDPVITVSGIKNQSANNDETIGFSISIADRNIPQSGINPTLTAVIREDNGQLKSITIDLGAPTISTDSQGNTVYTYNVTNLDIDGYYSLNCSALDYANHSVALINSEQDNGGNASEQTLNFSVNREGSAFWIETHHNYINDTDDIIDELDGKYVNGEVGITIHEVNVDKIDIFDEEEQKTSFTLNDGNSTNDISLVEGTNYTKNTSIGEGGWYETEYNLNNNNFDHDGTYSFNILTYDRAGNSNVNTKDSAGSIKFTVDRTNPVITSNVVAKQVIDADEFIVEFKVNDVNPDDQKVVVSLNNILLDEEQVESLGNNTYSFKMKSGSNQTFKISTVDLATNNSDKYEIEQVTISTNKFILFYYSHTALFWIIIASIVVVASGIIFIIFKRRNKKNEDE